MKLKPKALLHQVEVINYIDLNEEVALFDEQGLGKTKIVIEALCLAMKRGEIEGALVVAPMSLLYNWEQEVVKHSFLIPIVLRGTEKEKRYKFLTGANFYITNYEAVVAELSRIKRFCKSFRVAIVLDESARVKDPETKTANALFQIREYSRKRIIISGTPVANNPIDLWAQYFFIDGGKLLGDDFKTYKARFNERSTSYGAELKELQEQVTANSIRRCKNDVLQLPGKTFTNVYADLSDIQNDMYNLLREELKIEVENIDGDIITDEADNILKKLLRLTQIASNPVLIDKGYVGEPAKYIVLDKLISDIVARDEKVIIWTSFVENILLLKNRYSVHKPLVIYGQVPIKDRASIVSIFQDRDENRILIANPAAAREGLTLTRANNAIYLDRNFNLVDYLQSQDRIHRISQTKECKIYKIIARNTIDEYIDRIIELKKEIAQYVQGDTNNVSQESLEILLDKRELLTLLGG